MRSSASVTPPIFATICVDAMSAQFDCACCGVKRGLHAFASKIYGGALLRLRTWQFAAPKRACPARSRWSNFAPLPFTFLPPLSMLV